MSHGRSLLLPVICGLLALSSAPARSFSTVTTCDAANPFDDQPDDAALQACLDNYDWVLLKPEDLAGYVGYLISDTVKLRRDHILLTTADNPHKAMLVATPELVS